MAEIPNTLSTGPNWGATSVSDDGSVIVGFYNVPPAFSRVFRWEVGTGMRDIGIADYHSVHVSGSGAVIVGSHWAYDLGSQRAFTWKEGQLRYLPQPTGSSAVVNDVSFDGSRIVGACLDAFGGSVAILWHMQPNGDISVEQIPARNAWAISADGRIVVGQSDGGAFRWQAATGLELIGPGMATAVSGDGSVIAGRSSGGAYKWQEGRPLEYLPILRGPNELPWVTDVSRSGTVFVGGQSLARAFYYSTSAGIQNLGTLGGNYSFAEGVSQDGGTVVGWAARPSGYESAFKALVDRDADGLLDEWETHGLDINGDGRVEIDFPGMGADPDRKDIFVEIDAMLGLAPEQEVFNDVKAAFDAAPVPNPNGRPDGINLHLRLDDTQVSRDAWWWGAWDAFEDVKQDYFGTYQERNGGNWEQIKKAKLRTFRYCLFADQFLRDSPCRGLTWRTSGIAEIDGNDLMVTLGAWELDSPKIRQQKRGIVAGTFMHELGHTLGLGHGGFYDGQRSDTNFKPHYRSVMNYLWQMPDSFMLPCRAGWVLDYSQQQRQVLDEGSLSEPSGFGGRPGIQVSARFFPGRLTGDSCNIQYLNEAGPIDLNGDQDSIDHGVRQNVNDDINSAGQPLFELLVAEEDWSKLKYISLSENWTNPDSHGAQGVADEMTFEDYSPLPMSGHVELSDFQASAAGQIIEFEFQDGNGAVVDQRVVRLDQSGNYSLGIGLVGNCRVAAKAGHWLRSAQAVSISTEGATANFAVTNGDCDGDNEVGIGDYALLSVTYGLSVGEPGYEANADLNGDTAIDIADYAIFSTNYGEVGDE